MGGGGGQRAMCGYKTECGEKPNEI